MIGRPIVESWTLISRTGNDVVTMSQQDEPVTLHIHPFQCGEAESEEI
jgi:hypothetical protein